MATSNKDQLEKAIKEAHQKRIDKMNKTLKNIKAVTIFVIAFSFISHIVAIYFKVMGWPMILFWGLSSAILAWSVFKKD